MSKQGIPALLLLYVGVLATLAMLCSVGYVKITKAGEEYKSSPEKTILDGRMTVARQIKAALAKPQPQPEPLPPITAPVANLPKVAPLPTKAATPVASKVAAKENAKKLASPPKLVAAARNAMAMGQAKTEPIASAGPAHDRSSGGGW